MLYSLRLNNNFILKNCLDRLRTIYLNYLQPKFLKQFGNIVGMKTILKPRTHLEDMFRLTRELISMFKNELLSKKNL